MYTKLIDYLKSINSVMFVSNKKNGVVIPSKMDDNTNWGGLGHKELIEKLSPLLPEFMRVSKLPYNPLYPDPALFIGLKPITDIDKTNEKGVSVLESLKPPTK